MSHKTPALYAPWRMDYIRTLHKPQDEPCFLCQAAAVEKEADFPQRLMLWRTEQTLVVMNRYPYTNGHLLVAPRAHKANVEDLTAEELADMGLQLARAVKLLKRVVSAQGFNIGINVGRCAGAGLPGHLHQHVVPRWSGDINFISIVGEVSIIPQATSQLYGELRAAMEVVGA